MRVVLPMYLLWICRTCLFLRMEKPVRCYLGQHLNLELKYILKDKNACKYFSGLGPNKRGKGSYSSLYINKLLVVLSRMIHLSVFLRKPKWPPAGLVLAVTEVGKRLHDELVPTIALELYLKYLLTLLFTNLNLIGVISLVGTLSGGSGGKDLFFKTLLFWMWFGVFI